MSNGTYQQDYYGYDNIDYGKVTPPLDYGRQDYKGISLIRELSPQPNLQEVMQWLQGRMYNSQTNKWEKVEGAKPLMNEEGRDVFFHYATTLLSSVVTMSNYTNDYKRIHAIMKMIIKDASIHFHLNYEDYGINKKEKITLITNKLLVLGLSAFYKAIGAGDRKAATSNISETISTLMRPVLPESPAETKRRGMLRRLMGR